MQSSVNVDLLNTAAVTVSLKIGLNTRVHVKASGRQKSIWESKSSQEKWIMKEKKRPEQLACISCSKVEDLVEIMKCID